MYDPLEVTETNFAELSRGFDRRMPPQDIDKVEDEDEAEEAEEARANHARAMKTKA